MSEATFDQATLGNEARRLLKVLLKHAGKDGRAQISTVALLKESGLTQGALVRGRAELVRNLLLRIEKGYSANGLRGANVYALSLTALEPTSVDAMEGESDQNRTESLAANPAPGGSSLREGSSGRKPVGGGFLSWLRGRYRAS